MTDQAIAIIEEALAESARVKTALCEQAPVIAARIQEAHIALIHLLCKIVELTLFPESSPI